MPPYPVPSQSIAPFLCRYIVLTMNRASGSRRRKVPGPKDEKKILNPVESFKRNYNCIMLLCSYTLYDAKTIALGKTSQFFLSHGSQIFSRASFLSLHCSSPDRPLRQSILVSRFAKHTNRCTHFSGDSGQVIVGLHTRITMSEQNSEDRVLEIHFDACIQCLSEWRLISNSYSNLIKVLPF